MDELPGLRALEQVVVEVLPQGVVQRDAVLRRILFEECHAPLSDVPLRYVADSAEREVVFVGDHPQVGERVFDLHPVEELRAAVDGVGEFLFEEKLLDGSCKIMCPVEDRHVLILPAVLVEGADALRDPLRLVFRVRRHVAEDRGALRQFRDELLFDAADVLVDELVRRFQDGGCGAVVVHHVDGLHVRELGVELHEVPVVGTAPGVDGLVRVSDDEQVAVVARQHFHEQVLGLVDVLELVDHDVFEPLLPLAFDVRLHREDVEREQEQVVVVEAEALFLLVQIAVENDIVLLRGGLIFLVELIERHADEVFVVFRFPEQLLVFDHVPCIAKGHVPEGEAALLVDDLEHGVDVRVVEDQEILRVADGVAVLLQDGDAEAVERVDVACVVIAGQLVDALAHLVGRLVRERDAKDVSGQDADVVDKVSEPVGERSGLPGAGSRNDADEAFGRGDGFSLLLVEAFQEVDHGASSFLSWIVTIVAVTVAIYNVFSNKCFIFVESNNLVSMA